MAALFLAVNNLPSFPRSPAAALFLVLATTAVCLAELCVRRERELIGNLGMSLWTMGAASALPAVLAEACFALGGSLLG